MTHCRQPIELLDALTAESAEDAEEKRFSVFSSFITAKPDPNDVDVFLVMDDACDLSQVSGEARLLFDHTLAQAHFGAGIFWVRRLAALPSEEQAIASWELKRDGTPATKRRNKGSGGLLALKRRTRDGSRRAAPAK